MSAIPIKKPRSDSHLKNLPEDRQEAIFEECIKLSLREGVKWLAEDGIVTSRNSLSEFLSWYQLLRQFKGLNQDQQAFIELLKQDRPDLKPEEAEQFGAAYFTMQAVKLADPKTFVAVTTARNVAKIEGEKLQLKKQEAKRKDKELALAQQKFQRITCEKVIDFCEDQEVHRIATSNLPKAEKIEQLGLRIFGADWEDGK